MEQKSGSRKSKKLKSACFSHKFSFQKLEIENLFRIVDLKKLLFLGNQLNFKLDRKVKKGVKHAKMTPDFKSKAKN